MNAAVEPRLIFHPAAPIFTAYLGSKPLVFNVDTPDFGFPVAVTPAKLPSSFTHHWAAPALHPASCKSTPLPSLTHLRQITTVCFVPIPHTAFDSSAFRFTNLGGLCALHHSPLRPRPQFIMDDGGGSKDGGTGQLGPKPSPDATACQTPTHPGVPAWMLARNNSVHAPVFGQPSERKRYVCPLPSSARHTLTLHSRHQSQASQHALICLRVRRLQVSLGRSPSSNQSEQRQRSSQCPSAINPAVPVCGSGHTQRRPGSRATLGERNGRRSVAECIQHTRRGAPAEGGASLHPTPA